MDDTVNRVYKQLAYTVRSRLEPPFLYNPALPFVHPTKRRCIMPVYKDKNRETWFVKFYYKDSVSGETRQKLKRSFATREDALSYEKNFLTYNLSSAEGETFSRIYEEYMDDVSHTLKASTMRNKRRIFESKILPFFGKRKIESITTADVRNWQRMLMNDEHHYKKSYLSTVNAQLTTFMNYVNRIYGLPSNPCMRAGSMSGEPSKEVVFWTLDEYSLFREALKREDMRGFVFFEVLYWTGIRVGEFLAIHESDIDFVTREISINKTYTRFGGRDIYTSPKTAAGVRRIAIPKFLCDEIKKYLRTLTPSQRRDRIFAIQRSYLDKTLRIYSKKLNLPRPTIHGLRHSAVSLLIDQGFGPFEIGKRIGHTRPSYTSDRYGHLFPTKQIAIAKDLEKLERHQRRKNAKK